jgi:hypothetical protein
MIFPHKLTASSHQNLSAFRVLSVAKYILAKSKHPQSEENGRLEVAVSGFRDEGISSAKIAGL